MKNLEERTKEDAPECEWWHGGFCLIEGGDAACRRMHNIERKAKER